MKRSLAWCAIAAAAMVTVGLTIAPPTARADDPELSAAQQVVDSATSTDGELWSSAWGLVAGTGSYALSSWESGIYAAEQEAGEAASVASRVAGALRDARVVAEAMPAELPLGETLCFPSFWTVVTCAGVIAYLGWKLTRSNGEVKWAQLTGAFGSDVSVSCPAISSISGSVCSSSLWKPTSLTLGAHSANVGGTGVSGYALAISSCLGSSQTNNAFWGNAESYGGHWGVESSGCSYSFFGDTAGETRQAAIAGLRLAQAIDAHYVCQSQCGTGAAGETGMMYLTDAQVSGMLYPDAWQDYDGTQAVNLSSSLVTPTDPGLNSSVAQQIGQLWQSDPLVTKEIAHALDPTDFPYHAWAMPDCYGMSPEDCEAAIHEVNPDASITVTTAPTNDPSIAAGHVVATTPDAGTDSVPSQVTVSVNDDTANSEGCASQTDDPHWSNGSSTVLAKGRIICNYAGDASLVITLWRCSEPPEPDQEALEEGAWGCFIASDTHMVLVVSPGVGRGPIYVPFNPPWVPGDAYFIAETQMPNAETSWSPHPDYVAQP